MARYTAKTRELHLNVPILRSFERHLRAERKSEATISHYMNTSFAFLRFCEDEGLPGWRDVEREHVEMWLDSLHQRLRPASVRNHYLGLRAFYDWLAYEEEIARNPFGAVRQRRIQPPAMEEAPKDVATPEQVRQTLDYLRKAKRLRDAAVVAILYDTGMRAGELADARMTDLAESGDLLIPRAKGKRARWVYLSPATMSILDRYHRSLGQVPEHIVGGRRGKLTASGIYWAVRRAFAAAGIRDRIIGAHDLRHTSATHAAVSGDLSESDAMEKYGWTTADMWRHYSSQARRQASLAAQRRTSPMERLPRR
jgi:integrase